MQMQKKYLKIIGLLAVASMIALAGCAQENAPSGEETAVSVGEDVSDVNVGETMMFEMKITEKNHAGLVEARPPFQMEDSLERQNLIDRYKYLNDQNNVHHVYLLGNDGDVIAYYTAQGKVSSVNSKLTNDRQIVKSNDCIKETPNEGGEAGCYKTVESPQMDGSYGTNGDAIFFFTTGGHYVEWNGKYVVSEYQMDINTPISLEQQVDENGDPVHDENNNSTEEDG